MQNTVQKLISYTFPTLTRRPMPHEGPMRAHSQCPQDLPSVRSSFLPPVGLFIQFPNLDPNPSGRQLLFEARRRQRATRRGAAAAGGGRATARARGARHWRRQPAGSGLGPRREQLLRCAGPGLPAAACWRRCCEPQDYRPIWSDSLPPLPVSISSLSIHCLLNCDLVF